MNNALKNNTAAKKARHKPILRLGARSAKTNNYPKRAEHGKSGVRVKDVHEIALATQIADIALRAAKGRKVNCIHLRIGALRQVVPETLCFAWNFVAEKPPLLGSCLDIDWLAVKLKCTNGHQHTLNATDYYSQLCPECGIPAEVIQGEELTVVAIDIVPNKY